jgi:hypothetical protein
MKIFLLVFALMISAGCAPHVTRTGTLCVPPISIEEFSTSDPVEIRKDVVAQIEPGLRKGIIDWICQDTDLKVDKKCGVTDYILNLKLERVDTMTSGRVARTILGTYTASNRLYKLTVSGTLDKPGGEHVAPIRGESDMKPLDETIKDIAEEVTDGVQHVESP